MIENRLVTLVVFAAALVAGAVTAEGVVLDWVDVGDAGYGGVASDFYMSTYETTNAQYCEFLNAVVPVVGDSYGLYNMEMKNNALGGIDVDAGAGYGALFSVKTGMGDKPVNFVCWYDAIRFANWMSNGQPVGTASSYTETGAYTITGGGANSGTVGARNAGAVVWVPNDNEWDKAAYYKGGTGGQYWTYATRSDTTPTAEAPAGGSNSANFTGDMGLDGYVYSSPGPEDVGAYVGSYSAYGTFDQNGNVWEWNEVLIGSNAPLAGAGWSSSSTNLTMRLTSLSAATEGDFAGFRVASNVPEPTTIGLIGLGIMGLVSRRQRKA